MAEVRLGRLLFYDPILSGNRNIACATCHHPRFATSDGVSLSLGEGGVGLGPDRAPDPDNMPEQRIPRNSPALFNLGAHEFTRLFHDGRIEVDPTRPSGFRTPMGEDMAVGFSSLLSAQTMFPVLSQDEMAGHYGENDVSTAVRQGLIAQPGGAWDVLSARVAAMPEYARAFAAIDPRIAEGRSVTFADISDAIAAFMEFEWRSDESAFDRHIRGEAPLSGDAARGLSLFYGEAGCSGCHAGVFQTDHGFHAMGQPQIGPGKAARFERHARDEGRFRVTGRIGDTYRFRTPSLRNVSRTAPYGHAGAYRDLDVFIRSHARPSKALEAYDRSQAILPTLPGADDWGSLDEPTEQEAISAEAASYSIPLSEADLDALLAFLAALEDDVALIGRLGIPDTVPSGLRVPR